MLEATNIGMHLNLLLTQLKQILQQGASFNRLKTKLFMPDLNNLPKQPQTAKLNNVAVSDIPNRSTEKKQSLI